MGAHPVHQALVDAEFEVLRFLGVSIHRTATLDGQDPMWSPRFGVLLVPTDLTPEEAEELTCDVLGMIAAAN